MSAINAQPVTYGVDAVVATFSVSRYQRMIEADILDENDHAELLENYVVLKTPRDPKHDGTIHRILERLLAVKPAGWTVRIQSAITLSDSQPEPDLVLVRGNAGDYDSHHPGSSEIGLLIEVANTSLLRDKIDKARIYARASVPSYWIVNLMDGRIEVHTQPSGPATLPAYAQVQSFFSGDGVTAVLDGVSVGPIPVSDLI